MEENKQGQLRAGFFTGQVKKEIFFSFPISSATYQITKQAQHRHAQIKH
jgi:hypothetical protein